MDAVIEILKGLDYSPLYVSLKTGIVATIFSFFLGLFAARKVIKAGPKVKAIADGILDTLEEKGLWKPEGARNSSTASESGRTSSDADTSDSVSPADVSAKSDVGTLTNSGSVPDSPCTSDSAHMNPSDENTDSEFPNSSPSVTYSVQVGAFRNPAYARRLLNELTEMDFPADAGFTRSFVPKKLIRKAATATRPNTQNVFVHAEASFPNFSTNGKVNVLIISVPAVASKFLKILNTDLSYGSCVISAFNAEYGTLIAV